MGKILKAEYNGDLTIGDMVMPCAVLSDGTRIINETNIIKNFGSNGGKNYKLREKSTQDNESGPLPLFISSKALKPFVDEVFEPKDLQPIEYMTDGGKIVKGYDATILSKVCRVWIIAKNAGALQSSQFPKAEKAQSLIFNLADTAIIALVDEATGYQYYREKDELQQILKAYISEELLPWQKTFPDLFYKELFRLNGWNFTVRGIKKRPGVIGDWTNKLIYDQLPKGVKEELENKTPKDDKGKKVARLHQSLTPDIGHQSLLAQIYRVIGMFQTSKNMKEMWYNFNQTVLRDNGQHELPFYFDDQGRTIEPIEKTTLSSHNKSLKKALDFNPNEDKKPKKQPAPKLF